MFRFQAEDTAGFEWMTKPINNAGPDGANLARLGDRAIVPGWGRHNRPGRDRRAQPGSVRGDIRKTAEPGFVVKVSRRYSRVGVGLLWKLRIYIQSDEAMLGLLVDCWA